MATQPRQRAVVIGGGIGGLCCARVLSQYFERVTLIERDRLPDEPQHRAGVPQSHHVHALLLRGLLELERLFPGIERELSAHGARRMDLGAEFAHYSEWGWAPRARIEIAPLTMSRVLIESVIRRRVRGLARLELLESTRAKGLLAERDGRRVRVVGVQTDRGERPTLRAELVVDASGRNSKSPEWLEALGLPRVREQLVDAFSGYASRFYELAPRKTRWWRGMLIDAKPPSCRRWALLMPIEKNRVVLTLSGVNGEYPPTDLAGFYAYLDSLRSPVLAREIAQAKPVSEIHGHRALFNRARRYDLAEPRLAGFVITGDSAVCFNASHGQGMSMAAVAANALDDTLAQSSGDGYAFTRAFHKAQWQALRQAWEIATAMDLQWPGTLGQRSLGFRVLKSFGIEAAHAAHEDPRLKVRFGPCFQLIASPYSLLAPSVIARVVYAMLRRRLGAPIYPELHNVEDLDGFAVDRVPQSQAVSQETT